MRFLALLLLGTSLAGCTVGVGDNDNNETADGDGAAASSIPEPVVFVGNTTLANPAADLQCTGLGDSETHDLPDHIGGWDFVVDPASFHAYFYDSDTYLEDESARSEGAVPEEATTVEVCATEAPGEYVVTISHPDWTAGGPAPQNQTVAASA